jgi:hypothetical protein
MIECLSNNVMRIMCIAMLEECDVLFVALHTNFKTLVQGNNKWRKNDKWALKML